MFKLLVPITKAVSKQGKLLVTGIASSPSIDKDSERFDVDAISKMKDSVNVGQIPIRVEHEDKFYTDIGVWKEADLDKDNRLIVKGEIDTELSLGKDLEVQLVKRKMPIALSVGGKVVEAVIEYAKELGHNIKVYKDVILEEISVVKNPANEDASLCLSKSINWQLIESFNKAGGVAIPYSEEAKELQKQTYKRYKVSSNEFEQMEKKLLTAEERKALPDSAFAYVATNAKGNKVRKLPIHDKAHVQNALAVIGGARGGVQIPSKDLPKVKQKVLAAAKKFGVKTTLKTDISTDAKDNNINKDISMKNWIQKLSTEVLPLFEKMEVEEVVSDSYDPYRSSLTGEDLKVIAQLTNILSNVKLPTEDEMPEKLIDENFLMDISEDCFIIMPDRYKTMPHHNPDFSLDRELVLYQLKRLIDGKQWLTSKEYNIALNHLYYHLKQLSVVKSASNRPKMSVAKRLGISEETLELMKSSYLYAKGELKEVPTQEGKAIDEATLKKCANYYQRLINDNRFNKQLNSEDMSKVNKNTEAKDEDIKKNDVVTPDADEEKTEAVDDTSEKNTNQEPEVDTPDEVAAEDVPDSDESDTFEDEVEDSKDDTSEEVVEKDEDEDEDEDEDDEVEKAKTVEVKADLTDVTKTLKELQGTMNSFGKKVEDKVMKSVNNAISKVASSLEEVSKQLSEKDAKFATLEKDLKKSNENVEKISKIVETLSKTSLGRKSVASYQVIEKSFGNISEEQKSFQDRVLEKMEIEKVSYATAAAEIKKADMAENEN